MPPTVTDRQQSDLMEVSMDELAGLASSVELEMILRQGDPAMGHRDNSWVSFEAEVRSAHAKSLQRLRQERALPYSEAGERLNEIVRLLEIEEQTRCQAFQAALMGEVHKGLYQQAVRSIIEKLLGKLETLATEPAVYQGAAQCLSEYMSALNHHCDICNNLSLPLAGGAKPLPAIEEGSSYADYSEDTDTISNLGSEADSIDAAHDSLARCVLAGVASSSAAGHVAGTMPALESEEERERRKKERRRESNKRAASKYRSKKTITHGQLVNENGQLRAQLAASSSQNAVLAAENRLLKQQMAFLQSMLQGNPTAAASEQLPCNLGKQTASATTAMPPPPVPAHAAASTLHVAAGPAVDGGAIEPQGDARRPGLLHQADTRMGQHPPAPQPAAASQPAPQLSDAAPLPGAIN